MLKLVIVNLRGGLGNQMFEYAAAVALAEKHGSVAKVDLEWFAPDVEKETLRHYQLHHFHHVPMVASPDELPQISLSRTKWRRSFAKRLPWVGPSKHIFLQHGFGYDPIVEQLTPPIYLARDYFQSERYFEQSAALIRKIYQPGSALSAQNRDTMQAIQDSQCAVALHVRRGDYVNLSEAFPLCSREYYQRAAEIMQQRERKKLKFFIFSDDIAAAHELLDFLPNKVFVDNNAAAPWLDLHLMAACHHNIIANSSFSWWGAWLNPNPPKHIIAPANWFKPNFITDTQDLIPKTWQTL